MISSAALRRLQIDNIGAKCLPVQAMLHGYALAAASSVLLLGPAFTVNLGPAHKVEAKHISVEPKVAAATAPVAEVTREANPATETTDEPDTTFQSESSSETPAPTKTVKTIEQEMAKPVLVVHAAAPPKAEPEATPHIAPKLSPPSVPSPPAKREPKLARPADSPFETSTPLGLPLPSDTVGDADVNFELAPPQ